MRRFLTLALAFLLAAPVAAQHCDAGFPLGPKPTTDAVDDDFDGAFVAPWIFEADTAYGTVDLYRTTATVASTVDLSTRPGFLLMQNSKANESKVRLDQQYELQNGESYVCEFAISTGANENGYGVGISVHAEGGNPPVSGPYFQLFADAEREHGYRMLVVVTGRVHLNATSQDDQTINPSARLLFRVDRVDEAALGGSNAVKYHGFYSRDGGTVWSHVGSYSFSEPLGRIGIFDRIGSGASQQASFFTPIEAANWCCLGSAGQNPW